ncbi:hypothetical protein Tco_0714745 [Tanacetum coccineum]
MVGRSLNVDNDPFHPCEGGEEVLGSFYPNDLKEVLVGYADACYFLDPHKARSQTGYMLMNERFNENEVHNQHAAVKRAGLMVDFVPGLAVIDAAQRKRGKYMDMCAAIGYGFFPFSFSSLGELEADAVTLLKRIRKFSISQDN